MYPLYTHRLTGKLFVFVYVSVDNNDCTQMGQFGGTYSVTCTLQTPWDKPCPHYRGNMV